MLLRQGLGSILSHGSCTLRGGGVGIKWGPKMSRTAPSILCPSPTVLLAAGPVPGAGRHRRGQLLHHRAHHHWRPLHQEHAHAHAVCLLLCHPTGQVRIWARSLRLLTTPSAWGSALCDLHMWAGSLGEVPGPADWVVGGTASIPFTPHPSKAFPCLTVPIFSAVAWATSLAPV